MAQTEDSRLALQVVVLHYCPMLEGLLLTLIFGFAFAYIAVRVAVWWVDWDCRRSNTPENRQRLIQEQLNKLGREQPPANTES